MYILELGETAIYKLQAEKLQGKWWLELIERSTGLSWILYCDTKKHAEKCFEKMDMEAVRGIMERMKVQPVKMYKAGVI